MRGQATSYGSNSEIAQAGRGSIWLRRSSRYHGFYLSTSLVFFLLYNHRSSGADFEQKRRLVELLIDRVVVRNEEVEIPYVVPASARSEYLNFYQLVTDYFNNY